MIPAGFSEFAHGGAPVPVTVFGSVDHEMASEVAASLARSFVAQVNANQLSVAAAIEAGVPATEAGQLAAATAAQRLPVQVQQQPAGGRELRTISYYAPAMGIFFALFAIGFGARSFFDERAGGTIDRIAAAPLRPGVPLAGKSLSTFVYAVASLTTMAVLTSVVFDADWGPPAATAALIVAMAVVIGAAHGTRDRCRAD